VQGGNLPSSSLRIPLLAVVAALALAAPAAARPYPETIPLPDGWQPEGIANAGDAFFSGSRATGGIYRGDLRTGTGQIIVPGRTGGAATGMHVDHRRLFVAGAQTGTASVYTLSGKLMRTYTLTTDPSFINDVAVTRKAAYFTDSANQRLYVLRFRRHHRLPNHARTLPLTGDLQYDTDPDTFELNGVVDASKRWLISVQTRNGKLLRINSRTGNTREIDLGGGDVTNGDGLLLNGRTLYVVQNQDNQIAVVHLRRDLRSGVIKRHLTDSDLDVPTTIVRRGRFLFAVNARFTTPATPMTQYSVVRVER
jgi:hypothetical protein